MNVVITGASKGIGYATAKLLATDKSNTVVAISRDGEKLAALEKEAGAGTIIPIAFDLSENKEAYEGKLNEQIFRHLQEIDVLINNAGYLVNKPFEETNEADLQEVFSVNVFGIIKLSQMLIGRMGIDKRAHIVNIGSMGGYQGSSKFSGLAAYSASKGAVATLSECMAEEFKDRNIAVNCLALGAVQTEMLSKAFPGYVAPVQAEEMAKYIAEFAKKGMNKFNGEVIPVELA